MPSDMAYRSHFGSWGNALKAAGFSPIKFIPKKSKGSRNKNRKKVEDNGYWVIFEPSHPCANIKGYVREHRMIAYDAGLLTDLSMDVHHINGNKKDNRLENLEVMSASDHISHHHKGKSKNIIYLKQCWYENCGVRTNNKHGLCVKHYKIQWLRIKHKIIKRFDEIPNNILNPISNPIREFRIKNLLSQEDFAKFLGCGLRTLISWEQNHGAKPNPIAQRFLNVLYENPDLIKHDENFN